MGKILQHLKTSNKLKDKGFNRQCLAYYNKKDSNFYYNMMFVWKGGEQ